MDYNTTYEDPTAALAAMAGLFVFMSIAIIIGYVFNAIAMMLLYKKAGHPQAWAAWVPFYNTYVLFKFGGQKTLWFWIYLASSFVTVIPVIGSFAGFVGSIFATIAMIYGFIFINNSFGKQDNLVLWTLFSIFLTPIWALVLALGESQYFRAASPLFMNKEGIPEEAW